MNGKAILLVIAVAIFAFGFYLLLYPTLKTAVEDANAQEIIEAFQTYIDDETAAAKVFPPAREPPTDTQPFPALWEACQRYNETIYENKQRDLNAGSMQTPALSLSAYGYESDCFGYLSIPEADIEVPLFLGSSWSNLDRGAAILGQTSLPIGGKNTNCVIAGHRSWSGAIKFRSLEQLAKGDLVYLTNPWRTLTYEVIETKIISPDDVDEILIRDGCDRLSIFTCTNPNTRRFLVICQRKE